MALILILETATKNCSLALSENGNLINAIDFNNGNFSHAEKLHVFIDEILKKSKKKITDLNAVAISKGPGSYTGLRIGISSAKGLCYGLNIPLISFDTLKILTKTYLLENKISDNELLIPMIDARRMEVYTAVFNQKLKRIQETNALILEDNSFDKFLDTKNCHFFGDGAEKSKDLYKNEHTFFTPNIYPSAKVMAEDAYAAYMRNKFEDVAYFEPYYLKDFVDGNRR